jgi:hypothetical protein
MASEGNTAASRLNALRSTGPRTLGGKKRASQNALRHGLTVRLARDLKISSRVKRIARAIAGKNANPIDFDLATWIAELELDLRRIRMARVSLLGKIMSAQSTDTASLGFVEGNPLDETGNTFDRLVKIERYERRTLSRRKWAIRNVSASDY